MELCALLTSVGFYDFLELTLPHNKFNFDEIIVVTSMEDGRTQVTCKNLGIRFIATEAFGKTFNKGAALNEGLRILRQEKKEWVMITDADILWPLNFKHILPVLENDCLYGFPRRVIMREDINMYEDPYNFDIPLSVEDIHPLFLGGEYKEMATLDDIRLKVPSDSMLLLSKLKPYKKIEEPEIFQAMGWNSEVASTKENPLPLGYGQLFNLSYTKHNYPEDFDTAAGCDSYFSSKWDTAHRDFIDYFTTLHLGPRMVHWEGRNHEIC